MIYLKNLKQQLVYLLEKGVGSYVNNEDLETKIFGKTSNQIQESIPPIELAKKVIEVV